MSHFEGLPNTVKQRIKDLCPHIPTELKSQVYNILTELKTEHHGMAIVLGFDSHDDKMHVIPLFQEGNYTTLKGRNIKEEGILEKLRQHDYDGAILLDIEGNIVEDSVMLMGNPNVVVQEMNYDCSGSLNQSFGFKTLAGTRHMSAITNSHYIPHAMYFVLSEERGSVRVFNKAKIIYSPFAEEMMQVKHLDSSVKEVESLFSEMHIAETMPKTN